MKLRNGGGENEAPLKTLTKDTIPTLRGGNELETKLVKIAQLAIERPKEQFTSLIHLLDEKALYMCHQELNGDKAVGVDEVTKVFDLNSERYFKRRIVIWVRQVPRE
ncbi:hypothetical protein QNH46_21140 [Paenibacillus woosongensis]|uniref:Uncharacterized protein n=1 Tax=Paenibacillus woosongensis TaxID=307580 RepID=A0AA95I6Q7_9BACL|nr:hypothetical protein [Paenibacillus woosongensis]WHX48544.1 hypothetical protein QNH46_21140 [Paenibacillus woosongensis]